MHHKKKRHNSIRKKNETFFRKLLKITMCIKGNHSHFTTLGIIHVKITLERGGLIGILIIQTYFDISIN